MISPNILHVSTPLSWRGGEQQLAYTVLELAKLGASQTVLCRKSSKMAKWCEANQIRYVARKRSHSQDLGFAATLARIVKQNKVNIVHAHDSHAHGSAVLASVFFGMKQHIILHRRVDYVIGGSWFSRYKYNFRQIKKVICVSAEVKRVVSQTLKSPEKAIVIHSGIDLNKFKTSNQNILREEYGLEETTQLVGNVAAITQQKDYFTFVETARLFLQKNNNTRFFIIGTGDQLEEIKELVVKYGLQSHFTFTGFREDINAVLPCLDVLLFTSEKEGLGTTLIDAFAAKVAVVATNAGGIPELVEDGVTGMLAPVKDAEKLAAKLEEMLKDEQLRKQLIQNAFEKAQLFSKENTAAKIWQVYQEVLNK